ncbi:hypothetical protein ACFOW4_21280 [Micromonospora sp. GCM10011542]|uniref:hypothetical protein n=1 Tax=Micromonospora sp. GCM10011542 TaxID=3317337 RepID=UPI00360A5D9B
MSRSSALAARLRPTKPRLVELCWVLLVVAISAGLFLVRYEDPRRIAVSGDSYWYMRQAQMFAGVDEPTASARASRQVCRDLNRSAVDRGLRPGCRSYPQKGISKRYIAIFDSRPGYPLLAAPFVKALGAWRGMVAATMLLAVTTGLLMYLAAWMALRRRLVGILATVLLFLLPTGFWITRMLAEGAMLAGCLGTLIGAMVITRGRTLTGLLIAVPALAWTLAAKSANGVALALVLLVAGLVALLTRGANRRGALVTAALGLVTLSAWFTVSHLLALPSLNETIQDFATRHFRRPDIPDPYSWLFQQNVDFWPGQIRATLIAPLTTVATVTAAAVLIIRARDVALLWIGIGLSGLALLVAHPIDDEAERLLLPVWLPIAASFGYATALALGRMSRPRDAKPEPEAEIPQQPIMAGSGQ